MFITQLFKKLQSGSNGVLSDVDKISKETLRNGARFLMDLFSDSPPSRYNLEPLEENIEENDKAGESEKERYLSQQDRDEL